MRPAAEFKVLAALVLLLLDALLAVLVWLAAYELQRIWGRLIVIGWEGFPPLTAMVIGFFAVAVLCAAAAVTLNGMLHLLCGCFRLESPYSASRSE